MKLNDSYDDFRGIKGEYKVIINRLLNGESPTDVFYYMLENYPEFVQYVKRKEGESAEKIIKSCHEKCHKNRANALNTTV